MEDLVQIKVRARREGDILKVDFGYFDITDEISIDVTEGLRAMDKDDLQRLVTEDDPYVETEVIMGTDEFLEVQELLGIKLAEAYNGNNSS